MSLKDIMFSYLILFLAELPVVVLFPVLYADWSAGCSRHKRTADYGRQENNNQIMRAKLSFLIIFS